MNDNNRTMLTLTASGDFVFFHTVSHSYGRSSDFYVAQENLSKLAETGSAIADNNPSFLRLRVQTDKEGRERLTLHFTWLSSSANGRSLCRTERFDVDYADFKACVERAQTHEGEKQRLLSLRDVRMPSIRFESRKHLKDVAQNRTLRKKLGRFLITNFQWPSAVCIRLFDDFVPYSFFFREETASGASLCGGVILHEQEDLRKAKYAIHT